MILFTLSIHSIDGAYFVLTNLFLLQILSLDWSSGIESLKCIVRVDLTLNGSFADMVLLSSAVMETCGTLVLTNPGQLHFYDDACLSSSMSQHEKKNSVSSKQYPMVIPTIEPYMTVAKLGSVYREGKFSRAFSEVFVVIMQKGHEEVVSECEFFFILYHSPTVILWASLEG